RHKSHTDSFKYLGIQHGVDGIRSSDVITEASGMLRELDEAPLDTIQKMDILRTFAIPRLHYKLQLGLVRTSLIGDIDTNIRKYPSSYERGPSKQKLEDRGEVETMEISDVKDDAAGPKRLRISCKAVGLHTEAEQLGIIVYETL
ncbi:unnamed protein product, partial [Trichobilharzia regenti]